jgi:hypothetical protein
MREDLRWETESLGSQQGKGGKRDKRDRDVEAEGGSRQERRSEILHHGRGSEGREDFKQYGGPEK